MSYSIEDIKRILNRCAESVSARKEELEKIDSAAGDGDLGISMQKAAEAIINTTATFDDANIGKLFSKCAMAVNGAAPSTMGTLICAGFMQLGKRFANLEQLEKIDVYEIPGIIANAIMMRGKANEGDRTVLDALLPVVRVYQDAAEKDLEQDEALAAAASAAKEGMEKTKTLQPKIGRAKWTPDNAIGNPDGGALLCCIVTDSFLSN